MRFSTLIFSAVVVGSALVASLPLPFSAEQDVFVRSAGDVSVFEEREVTSEEIQARDAAYAAAMGGDSLEFRDVRLPEDATYGLVTRQLAHEPDGRDTTELEPRGLQVVGQLIAQGIDAIVNLIKGKIENDKNERGRFTLDFIGEAMKKWSGLNWVMCHTRHSTKFEGEKGKDWGHFHREFPVSFGKTIGYEIYWFTKGVFERLGDGGALNWAYAGDIKSKTNNGATVTFD